MKEKNALCCQIILSIIDEWGGSIGRNELEKSGRVKQLGNHLDSAINELKLIGLISEKKVERNGRLIYERKK